MRTAYAHGGVAPRQVLRNPAGLDEALGDVPRVAQVNAAAAAVAAAAMKECGRSHRQPIRSNTIPTSCKNVLVFGFVCIWISASMPIRFRRF